MSIKGKRDKESGRIGFDKWNLESATFPQELVNRVLREGLELAAKEYMAVAWFKLSPKKNDDPTAFRVSLPIGPEDVDGPAWYFTLTEMVKDYIENDLDDAKRAEALRDKLRELAQMIDAAIPK